MSGIAYLIIEMAIIRDQGPHSKLAAAVGSELKGKLSASLYAIAIALAFVNELIADAIYVCVALMWLVPDRRIETKVRSEKVEVRSETSKL